MYVNVYIVIREYGGPEEGGWWYDTGEPIESRPCEPEETDSLADELREKYRAMNEEEERRCRSSALSDGEYEVYVEDDFAQPFPEFRPCYE